MANTIDYFLRELHAKRAQVAMDIPAFGEFVLQVVNILNGSPESFWHCRIPLAQLAKSRAALAHIENELLRGLRSAHYLPELTLLECDRFSLLLRFLSPSPTSTALSAFIENRMIAMIHGTAQLHRFEQPKPAPLDIFDRERNIVSRGISSLHPGDVADFRAAADCCQMATENVAILFEMRSEPLYTFQWFYDAATLSPKRIVFVDPQDMRAELGLLTALKLRSSDSIPYVRCFLDHPNHFIRWSAIKALVHLQPERADAHLSAAVHDCHPQIRAAGRQLGQQVGDPGKEGIDGRNATD